ncbi:MAG: phage holin family protein [Bacteroidota bacterium]|nr:phage holin family protein [Bacteroidota bacterium]
MKTIIKLLLTAIIVYLLATFLPGVTISDFSSAIIVTLVLALLNVFVRPILIFMTLPATLVTFGLFLLVINAFVLMMTDYLVDSFKLDSFWIAILFSLILSVFQSVLYSFADKKEK